MGTLENLLKLLLSAFLSSLLGIEREYRHKPAGVRTHILVSVGATIFTILSSQAFPGADPARVASYIVAGIGFIGAGTIFKEEDKVVGLTTAASLWLTSSIGMAVGVGFYDLAVFGTIIGLLTLLLKPITDKLRA
ncbi:MgtC/SapB family protein [Nanoarchaeota archaeon NZ13-N]|uniref:MgtC/SapB/SrpB/YhiD N-terminal domain-containing protein n=1 Tax=Candidatus Nanoclepta minutus TaxID=1940235 RepID=A0A397WM35_9ARCH|nr:MAG: MgtC/SapB family protein [Nanoarchaeota archaeon NZ13-N]RIB35110.1 MAG: hypothetical protein BXU00_03195 [Candidatus Nanoclepta minutus]